MTEQDGETSPLIEKVKGKAKQVAGNLIGNDALAHEGDLHVDKAAHVERAQVLDEKAERKAEASELDAREAELTIEQQRIAAEEQAEGTAEAIEREHVADLRRIDHDAQAAEAEVRRRKEVETTTADRRETAAAIDAAAKRAEAAALEAEARQRAARAEALEQAAGKS